MNRYLLTIVIALGIFTFNGTGTVHASSSNNPETEAMIKKIESYDPYKLKTVKFSNETIKSFQYKESGDGISLDYSKQSGNFTINKNGKEIKIGLPNNLKKLGISNLDGTLISSNETMDLVTQVIDGGIRQTINIKSKEGEKSYDFPILLPNGYTIEETASGGILIFDDSKKIHSFLMAPWAKDANNKDVKTYYRLIGKNIIRQYIEFDDNSVFPILADPTWCSSFINYTQWNYIGFYDSTHPWYLSVYPTSCGSASIFGGGGFAVNYSWEEMLGKTPATTQWNKAYGTNQYWSMYYQYACHANFAWWKTPWNLEPTRANVGYTATVNALCNP